MKRKPLTKIILTVLLIATLSSALSVFAAAEGGDGSGENTSEYERISALARSFGCTDPITKYGPQITFLIHGFDGDASVWSNDFGRTHISTNFAFTRESIIRELGIMGKPVLVARCTTEYEEDHPTSDGASFAEGTVKEGTEQEFKLYELVAECTCYDKDYACVCGSIYDLDTLGLFHKELSGISYDLLRGPITVIFEASDSRASNRRVYEEFKFVANEIIKKVGELNCGYLPRINLVAHGRGGLTAMEYALDHPYLVDTMITLGTPFSGIILKNEALLNLFGISTDPDKGEFFNFGMKDLTDRELTDSYRERWNSGYEESYSHIKFHALGSYATTDAWLEILANSTDLGELYNKINLVTEPFDVAVEALTGAWIFNHITALLGDSAVSLPSQLARGYVGAERMATTFFEYNINYDMRSHTGIPTPHNVIAGDADVVKFIGDRIEYRVNYDYRTVENTADVYIKNGVVFYPTYIHGDLCEDIPSYMFYNMDEITSVVIPPSVKRIGQAAFANCSNLESVIFTEGSQLVEIADEAFMGCGALTSIDLPESLKKIGSSSFAGTSLTSVTLKANIESISSLSFRDSKLTEYIVDEDCPRYQAIDGVLYTKNYSTAFAGESLISYPPCKPDRVYKMPTVAMGVGVSSYAFYNAKNLVEVDLGSHGSLSRSMFEGCSSLTEIKAPELFYVEIDALKGTPIINGDEETLIIGMTLIKYRGDAKEYTIPESCIGIAPYAFEEAQNLKSVSVGRSFRLFSDFAFANCTKLKKLYIDSHMTVGFGDRVFENVPEGVSIYVAPRLFEEYTEREFLKEYKDCFKRYFTRVIFDTKGGGEIKDKYLPLYGNVDQFPIPKREGYNFVCWTYRYNGRFYRVYNSVYPWQIMTPEIVFEAEWESAFLETQ